MKKTISRDSAMPALLPFPSQPQDSIEWAGTSPPSSPSASISRDSPCSPADCSFAIPRRSRFVAAASHGFCILEHMDNDSSYGLLKVSRERDQLTCFLEFNWCKEGAEHEHKVLSAVGGVPFIVPLLQHIGGGGVNADIFVFPCGFSEDALDMITESPTLIKRCAWQLLMGLERLHANGFVHGAMRAESVAYDESSNILVLGDFGRRDRELIDPYAVAYASPEVLSSTAATAASDMWGAGILITEWVMGHRCHAEDQSLLERKQDIEDARKEGLLLPELRIKEPAVRTRRRQKFGDEALTNLLRDLLQLEPTKRLTAAKALAHPYFESLGDWRQLQARNFSQWVEKWKSQF